MTNPTVEDIAKLVRKAGETVAQRGVMGVRDTYTARLGGWCYICSRVLVSLLRRNGHKATLVLGEYFGNCHCWVELPDGKILDVTATQFGVKRKIYTPSKKKSALYLPKAKGRTAERYVRDNWMKQQSEVNELWQEVKRCQVTWTMSSLRRSQSCRSWPLELSDLS